MSLKLKTTNKSLDTVPKKYVRLVISEKSAEWHRLVETKEGNLEYHLGAGKYKNMTPRKFRLFLRTITQAAKSHQIEYLAVQLSNSPFPQLNQYDESWILSTMVENFMMADYEYRKYKTSKKKQLGLKEILICGGLNKAAKAGFERGIILSEAISLTRDIANESGADMTPLALAAAAKKSVAGTKAKVTIHNHKKIKAMKMGLIDAVGKGADDEPCFIVMEYWGAKKTDQPLMLVGKGITYDTGGLNIKPSGHMHDMHMDMSGGAAAIGAFSAAVKLGLKKNIVALIPAAENAVSDRAMRAGDIITSMSGQTVEVIHTDAEGRLVLADALTYASKHYKPKAILDMATLTGAALVALGKHASAIMTKDHSLQEKLQALGEESGDYVWPLPLWDEYKQYLKSSRADIANIDPTFARTSGTIEGGTFLSFFAPKGVPWAHIDIAPRMESIPSDKLAKGAAGEPVRLLVKFLESY